MQLKKKHSNFIIKIKKMKIFAALLVLALAALANASPLPDVERDPMQNENMFQGDIAGVKLV